MQALINKAKVLIEALPYIKKFTGEYFVIKYGGQAMVSQELKESVVLDIVLLQQIGVKPVVVHGGGKEVTSLMERLGLEASFVGGLRVTDRETMELVEMVLAGKVNSEIVSLFNCAGGSAVGLSGKDGGLFLGKKRPPVKVCEGGEEQLVDLGYAGEITQVNTRLVLDLSQKGYIPVISTVGVTPTGESLNINADHAAGALAAALKATKLIMMTDVGGIYEDPDDTSTLISQLSEEKALKLVQEGKINKGMIPKVESCLIALAGGTKGTHIIDGCLPHSLLIEIFTDGGIGTMVNGGDGYEEYQREG